MDVGTISSAMSAQMYPLMSTNCLFGAWSGIALGSRGLAQSGLMAEHLNAEELDAGAVLRSVSLLFVILRMRRGPAKMAPDAIHHPSISRESQIGSALTRSFDAIGLENGYPLLPMQSNGEFGDVHGEPLKPPFFPLVGERLWTTD